MFFLTRSYLSQLFLQKQMQTYIHSKWCCLDARETSPTCFTFVCVLKTLSLCTIPTCWSLTVGWQSGATQANTLKREFAYNGISCTNASNIEQKSIPSNNHLGGKQNSKHFNTPPKKSNSKFTPESHDGESFKTKFRLSFLLNSSVFLRLWLSLAVLCITAALLGLFLPQFSMVKDCEKTQCKMGDVECDHIWQPDIMKSWCILQSLTVKGLWKDILKSSKIHYLSKIFSNLHPFFMFTCFQVYLCSDSI